MAVFFIYNGQIHAATDKIVGPGSRALRYGDGLFETMRMKDGMVPLSDLHFDRLFRGLNTLQFIAPLSFNANFLTEQVIDCAHANNVAANARIRLNLFRSGDSLELPSDPTPQYIVEAFALNPAYSNLNEEGWQIDVYPHARKSCDIFSGLKSNNFQPYLMAALYAKSNHLDDALVLNQHDRIADSTIANIFIVKNGVISTNPVDEGCVDGVMRKWIAKKMADLNMELKWAPLHTHDLLDADEIFLTNAVAQMRWVKQFRKKSFSNKIVKDLYQLLFA